jgi:hypothetical protein
MKNLVICFFAIFLLLIISTDYIYSYDFSNNIFNNSGNMKEVEYTLIDKKAAVFKDGTVEWYYNPAYERLTKFTQREAIQAFKKAMRSWSRVCSIRFSYKGITMKRLDNLEDDIIVVGFWPESTYNRKIGDSGGITKIAYNEVDGIHDGYIALNIFNKNEEYAPKNLDELQGIITHEVGHLIGIGHSNRNASVMSISRPNFSYEYQKTLKRDDKRAARALYPLFGIGAFLN